MKYALFTSGAGFIGSELARSLAQEVGQTNGQIRYVEPRPGNILRLFSDTKRINEIILKGGSKRLINWYLDQTSSPDDLLNSEKVRNWDNYGTDAEQI